MIFRFDGIDFYGTEATGVVFKGDNDIDDDDDNPKMMSTFPHIDSTDSLVRVVCPHSQCIAMNHKRKHTICVSFFFLLRCFNSSSNFNLFYSYRESNN